MSLLLLLDTHSLLWWVHQPASLSKRAQDAIGDPENDIFVSPVSAIEIAIKRRKDKLEFSSLLATDFVIQTAVDGFRELAITSEHAQLAGSFPSAHADPWDRLLAAQAQTMGLRLVTKDAKIASFGVDIFW